MSKKKSYDVYKVTRAFVYDKEKNQFTGSLNKMFAIIEKDILDAAVGEKIKDAKAIAYVGTEIEAMVTERVTAKDQNKFWVKVEDIKSIKYQAKSSSSMSEDPVLKRVRSNIASGKRSSLGYYSLEIVLKRLRENNQSYRENGFPEYYQTPNTIKSFIQDISTIKVGNTPLGDVIFGKGTMTNVLLAEMKKIYDEFVDIARKPIMVNSEVEEFVSYDNITFDDPFAKDKEESLKKEEIKLKSTEVVESKSDDDSEWVLRDF